MNNKIKKKRKSQGRKSCQDSGRDSQRIAGTPRIWKRKGKLLPSAFWRSLAPITL
jgi:hypothetical protein